MSPFTLHRPCQPPTFTPPHMGARRHGTTSITHHPSPITPPCLVPHLSLLTKPGSSIYLCNPSIPAVRPSGLQLHAVIQLPAANNSTNVHVWTGGRGHWWNRAVQGIGREGRNNGGGLYKAGRARDRQKHDGKNGTRGTGVRIRGAGAGGRTRQNGATAGGAAWAPVVRSRWGAAKGFQGPGFAAECTATALSGKP